MNYKSPEMSFYSVSTGVVCIKNPCKMAEKLQVKD